MRAPKILAVASAVDLDFRYGCTPAWWQLWKGLYEAGVDLVVTPYRGRPIESPWWRVAPNPTYREGETYAALRDGLARLKGDRYLRRAEDVARREPVRPDHARDDLACRDAALAAPPRAADRAGAARRRRRVHGADGPLPRHPDSAARAVRDPGRLLRRRRADEPARVRRHGHGLQLLPRRRPVRVRPRPLELRGWARRGCSSSERAARRRSSGAPIPEFFAPQPVEKEMDVFFYGYGDKFRREWTAAMVGEPSRAAARDRLRARRPRLPRRHRARAGDRRRALQRLRARDLGGADQPQHHAPLARDRAASRPRAGRSSSPPRARRSSPTRTRGSSSGSSRAARSSSSRTPSRRWPRIASCSATRRRPRRWARGRASACSTSTRTRTGRVSCSTSLGLGAPASVDVTAATASRRDRPCAATRRARSGASSTRSAPSIPGSTSSSSTTARPTRRRRRRAAGAARRPAAVQPRHRRRRPDRLQVTRSSTATSSPSGSTGTASTTRPSSPKLLGRARRGEADIVSARASSTATATTGRRSRGGSASSASRGSSRCSTRQRVTDTTSGFQALNRRGDRAVRRPTTRTTTPRWRRS